MFLVKSFVVRFYFHHVLSVCFEIRDEAYGGRGPTLTDKKKQCSLGQKVTRIKSNS